MASKDDIKASCSGWTILNSDKTINFQFSNNIEVEDKQKEARRLIEVEEPNNNRNKG